MRCEEFQPLIEEYLDKELTETTAGEVARHLDDCVSCAEVAGKLSVEREMYSRYEPDIQVTPDLWAGVQASIAADKLVPKPKGPAWLITTIKEMLAVPRVSGWATAALVLLAVGSTVVFMKYMQSEMPHPQPEVRAVVEPPTPIRETAQAISTPAATGDTRGQSDPERPKPRIVTERTNQAERQVRQVPGPKTPHQLVNEAEQKYLAAIAMLSRSAARKRSQMDPVTLEKLDQAIAAINRTIAGTRKAVREHPDDPIAVQYMLTAYARKVDVLREVAAQ
jgi:hypothetical protein